MKYFFTLFILFLPFNSFAEEKKLEHFCKMDTKFYETDKNEWSQKTIDYDLVYKIQDVLMVDSLIKLSLNYNAE